MNSLFDYWIPDKYFNFCKKLSIKHSFLLDYQFIYKLWVLCDLYNIASDNVRKDIKDSLDIEIGLLNNNPGIIKRLIESAFIFANLDSNTITVGNLTSDQKEKIVKEVDDIKNKSYRIAISIYQYTQYIKNNYVHDLQPDDNTIIYHLFTRLWILSRSRNEIIEDTDILSLDIHLKIEASKKELKNQFSIRENLIAIFWDQVSDIKFPESDSEIFLSDFQKELKDRLIGYKSLAWSREWLSMAISAPTSAWKTYTLKLYIVYKVLEAYLWKKNINIVFVVPTKALINELKLSFSQLFRLYWINESICAIHSQISWDEFISKYQNWNSNLFIMTQERLNMLYNDIHNKNWISHYEYIDDQSGELKQEFVNSDFNFKIDVLIVDEAHKVWYWYRWTLLSYIVTRIRKDNPAAQFILLAPLLSKLWKFKAEFNLTCLQEEFSNFWLVAKNEIFVKNIKENSRRYNTYFYLKMPECTFNLPSKEVPLFQIKRNIWNLVKLGICFGKSEGVQSIIFRSWPFFTQKSAKALSKQLNGNSSQNIDISYYIKEILPDSFELGGLLERGIAYHNGILPSSIKSKIEELFRNGEIKYLCANSTVLEWVNLPAKNIFIWSDAKKDNISDLDFRNLIGRCGRLNEHLSWNVFYVDFTDYEKKIPANGWSTVDFENNISKWLDDTEFSKDAEWKSKFDRFLEYIKPWNTTYKEIAPWFDNEKKDFEYLLWYFVSQIIAATFDNERVLSKDQSSLTELESTNTIIQRKKGRFSNFSDITQDDIFDKAWNLIYWDNDKKNEKIAILRNYILILCNDYLDQKNISKDFFTILQKNIFIDPRKQIDFYEKIRRGGNDFLLKNIHKYQENFLRQVNNSDKKTLINTLTNDVEENFYLWKHWWEYFWWLINQWISSIPLKWIFDKRKNPFDILDKINKDIQFNYLNAFSIYFELTNLWYKEYIQSLNLDIDESDIPKLDQNFVYYMELGTFYPNLIYIISRWVSRESAIWMLENDVIVQQIEIDSWEYFMNNRNNIMTNLEKKMNECN
jgi:hypothetical protein